MTDQLTTVLRHADPVLDPGWTDEVPPTDHTVRTALARSRAASRTTVRRRVLAATAVPLAAAAVVLTAVAVEEPTPRPATGLRLVRFEDPRATQLPFGIAVAPSTWHLAGSKGGDGVPDVVTIAPPDEGTDSPRAITLMHYRTTDRSFPAGYEGPGPVTRGSSAGRPLVAMRGTQSWAVQLALPDGSSLVTLLPTQLSAAQVQRFVDGVTVR